MAASRSLAEIGAGDQMARVLRSSPLASTALQIVAVAAAYYVAAKIGLELAVVRGQVTPFWPPTGIALAALLLWGPRTWPGIALGAFLVNAPIGPSVFTAAVIALGNTMAPVVAYLLLTRTDFRPQLDRVTDALRLVFFGALASSLVSASIGTMALLASNALPARDFWVTWSVWWTGDAMGLLLVAPLLLTFSTSRWPAPRLLWWLEAAAVLLGCVGLAAATALGQLPFLFYMLPLAVWAAVRFRHLGATPCALIVSTGTIIAASRHVGPFQDVDTLATMAALQAFNGTVALTCLLLAAVMAERDRTYREIRNAVAQVSAVLAQQPAKTPLETSAWRSLRQITGAREGSARVVSQPTPPPE